MSFSHIQAMATRNANNRLCCRPFCRGTLLLLVWSALLNATQCFVYDSIIYIPALPNYLQFGALCAYFALLGVIGKPFPCDSQTGTQSTADQGMFQFAKTIQYNLWIVVLKLRIDGLVYSCLS